MIAPEVMSEGGDRPRHATTPGGGSVAQAGYPPSLALLILCEDKVFGVVDFCSLSAMRRLSSSLDRRDGQLSTGIRNGAVDHHHSQ